MSHKDKLVFNTRVEVTSASIEHTQVFNKLPAAQQEAYGAALARQGRLDELPVGLQARFRHVAVTAPENARVNFRDQKINNANVHSLEINHKGPGHISISRDQAAVRAAANFAIDQARAAQQKPNAFREIGRIFGFSTKEEKEAATRLYGTNLAGRSVRTGLISPENLAADIDAGRFGKRLEENQSKLAGRQKDNVKIDEGSYLTSGDMREAVAREIGARAHSEGIESSFHQIGQGIFATIRETISVSTDRVGHFERGDYAARIAETEARNQFESMGGDKHGVSFEDFQNRPDGFIHTRNGELIP